MVLLAGDGICTSSFAPLLFFSLFCVLAFSCRFWKDMMVINSWCSCQKDLFCDNHANRSNKARAIKLMTLGRNSLFYPLWCHTVVVPYHSVVENFCTLPYRLQYVYMHQSKVYPRQRCHTIKHATLSVDQKSTLLFLTLTILSQFRFILIVTPTYNKWATHENSMYAYTCRSASWSHIAYWKVLCWPKQ